MRDNNFYMEEALREAYIAAELGEVPVGAVVVKDGEIIARSSQYGGGICIFISPCGDACDRYG